jgi:hypothetical protein
MQIPLLTTRFNNATWQENCSYKERNGIQGCIYGSATKIKETIPLNSIIYIIEMNNSLNKIEGIGLVRNISHFDKYYKIYSAGTYNRYIYMSNYRIDRSNLDKELLQILDNICFKGKTHLKRGIGFTSIMKRSINTNCESGVDINSIIKESFLKKYGKDLIVDECEQSTRIPEKKSKKRKLVIID